MFIDSAFQKLISGYQTRSTKNDTNAIKAPLKAVKVNDELKVEILKVAKDGALVKLSDGSEMTIAGNIPENAEAGMFLNIVITAKEDGKPLAAEIVSLEKMTELKIEELTNILKELGITPNKENLEIVNDMYKNNIEVSKENIDKTFNMIKNLNTSKENILFLMKNDIEVTAETTRAFDSMLKKSDFLEDNLKVLINTLSDAIDEVNQNINVNKESTQVSNLNFVKSDNIAKELITNEENGTAALKNGIINEDKNADSTGKTILSGDMNVAKSDGKVTASNPEELINSTKLPTENEVKSVDNVNNLFANGDKINDSENSTLKNPQIINYEKTANAESISVSTEVIENFEFDIDNLAGKNPDIQNSNADAKTVTVTKDGLLQTEMTNVIDEAGNEIKANERLTGEKTGTLTNDIQTKSQSRNLNGISNEVNINMFEKESLMKKEKLETLREEVVGLFREVRNTKDLGEDISMRRIFKSFKDLINDIETNRDNFTKQTADTLSKETTRMRENLELISDLNKYNTIVHIPIQINNNKSVAELYVFNGDKESSKRKINENNATMFLSLGTANMGQIESYIKIVNKTVECNFMSESEIGTNFINDNKVHLSELLEAYGYTLIKAHADTYSGKSLNIFEAIKRNEDDEIKKGFDARA